MAKKSGYRRAGKSAYRMTARRKTALRKAQLVSARKRRGKHAAVAVGVLAGGALVAYGGHKYGGKASDVASSVKHKLSMNNVRNSIAGRISPELKEAQMKLNAVSPASAAHIAAPTNTPNLNASHSAPAPNKTPKKGLSSTFGSWSELAGTPGNTTITHVPQAESIIDPQKPVRSPFPSEHMPTIDQVMHRINFNRDSPISQSQVTREHIQAVSLMWEQDKLRGVKLPTGHRLRNRYVGNVSVYTGILDMFGLETAKAENKSKSGKA